jgi:hypothetical protein
MCARSATSFVSRHEQATEKASLQGRREKAEGRKQSNFSLLPFAFSLQAAFFSSLLG